ncbi:MAG: DinB family protein [Nocardioides sp.]
MTGPLTDDLREYLQESRDAVVRSLEDLSEYDVRRPLVPSGTNLLGLVKHLTGIELGYLGASVGRPSPVPLPWEDDGSVWESADMWATPDQSREYLLGLYRRAWQHSDESLATIPLDAPASVAWWTEGRRETTFGHLLARVLAETAQHAGHCDIVRELIDGRGGRDASDLDADWWDAYLGRIRSAADAFRPAGEEPPA